LAGNYLLSNDKPLLGNENIPAISFSGYRKTTRGDNMPNKNVYCPTIEELKEDMKIMSAMGIKLLRTYDTQLYDHAPRLLEAIRQLKSEDSEFEMYVMLGAWITCINANTDSVNHNIEDTKTNQAEMDRAIELAAQYPDIVKIIAVGNEAMVHWQLHWVNADVILKWVRYAKAAKTSPVNGNILPQNILLTSSDNFASWGALPEYRNSHLQQLIDEVDFISLHTYPFHDTHWNPDFWQISRTDSLLTKTEKINQSMENAFLRAVKEYKMVQEYLQDIDKIKPIHLGETGWATVDDKIYHGPGSGAADEVKMKIYYDALTKWCRQNNISCFYFEAFDEPWKGGELGAESHFGLFTVDGKAKYALWNMVDSETFSGLKRGGKAITKTYNGQQELLEKDLLALPIKTNN
jgi:exo-beta-1,3-glucanase (GH17 family)